MNTMEKLSERLNKLMEGLDVNESKCLLEELIDEYTLGVYGVTIIEELKKVKLESNGKTTSIQTMANGRCVLISAYGFDKKSESKYPNGRYFLVLDEKSEKDFNNRLSDFN